METPRFSLRPGAWRHRLRRELGWALLLKLAALIVLWALFFSPSHRISVDAPTAADRLALEPQRGSAHD